MCLLEHSVASILDNKEKGEGNYKENRKTWSNGTQAIDARMEEEEDVTTNPFFITLKQRHTGLYQLVQSKCYVVCVPQAASLAGTTLSEDFLSTPASLFRSTPPCPQPLGIHLRCRHAIDQFFKSIKRLIVIHPVVELHILASSPYFQGSFTTLSDKSVELEDNHITTTEGSLALREIRHHSHNL